MKTHNILAASIALWLTALLPGLSGCSDNTIFGIWPPPDGNLVSNPSFESNISPTLEGWTPENPDTSLVNFTNDVPPGGGLWSVSLRNVWTFPGKIRYAFPPPTADGRYRLAVWGRAVKTGGMFAGGTMSLLTSSGGVDSVRRYIHFSDSTWTYGQLDETISAAGVDSVIIQLQGNIDQWSDGYIHFDLCSFELLR